MQLRIFFVLLTLAILGLAIGSSVYILEKVEKPKGEVVKQIKESKPKPIDPGIREFGTALALLQNQQFLAARDKLRYIIQYFPNSSRFEVARRLCGEINLDLLVSPSFKEGKIVYEVKRGDAVSRIASKQETTMEFVKRVNQLTNFKISPGDQLLMKPLVFKASISMKSKRLTLTENGDFFKEYPIQKATLPRGVALPFESKVRNKLAWLGKDNVSVTEAGYDQADKQIRLRRPGIAFQSEKKSKDSEAAESTGIFMDSADVDELCLLLRLGAPVTIAP